MSRRVVSERDRRVGSLFGTRISMSSATRSAIKPPRYQPPPSTFRAMSDAKSPRLKRNATREQDDPKVIGMWKIGRTIGKGSQGMREQSGTALVVFRG